MKEIFLACAVVAIFVLGFFIMKKVDGFLENNRRRTDEERTENQLLLAFDNPMIHDSLTPIFEAFSKKNPDCQLRFLFGKPEEILDELDKNRVDFGFISHTASENQEAFNCLILSSEQNSIFCENIGYPLEPLNRENVQTSVIWKKDSDSALTDSFCDILLLFSKKVQSPQIQNGRKVL